VCAKDSISSSVARTILDVKEPGRYECKKTYAAMWRHGQRYDPFTTYYCNKRGRLVTNNPCLKSSSIINHDSPAECPRPESVLGPKKLYTISTHPDGPPRLLPTDDAVNGHVTVKCVKKAAFDLRSPVFGATMRCARKGKSHSTTLIFDTTPTAPCCSPHPIY